MNKFKRISSTLRVYDYMGKGSQKYPGQTIKNYLRINGQVYNAIYDLIGDSKGRISYTRILALPIYAHFGEKRSFDQPEEVAIRILHETSFQLFNHICKCIVVFGDKLDKNGIITESGNTHFIVSRMPTRIHQYALIDEDLIYNEYYHLDDKGSSNPSFVITNDIRNDAAMRDLLAIYTREYDGHIRDPKYKLNSKNVPEYFEKLINFYKNEYKDKNMSDGLKEVVNEKIESMNKFFSTDYSSL